MEDDKVAKKAVRTPGSLFQRLRADFWYGLCVNSYLFGVMLWHETFRRVPQFDYDALPKRPGQIAVLTGGTRGIGFDLLKKLLKLEMHIIVGARSTDAAQKSIDAIRESGTMTGSTSCFELDLKSLKSVRRFAEDTLNEVDRIDLLINNAGIMYQPFELTEDGFESHFQVNYMSHFLLTQLLLPKIKATAANQEGGGEIKCRIVNVSSIAHFGSSAGNLADVPLPKVYSPYRAYCDSKLCQILSTKRLESKLKAEGCQIGVYSTHPGVIPTELVSHHKLFGRAMKIPGFYRNINDGGEVVMSAAISPKFDSESGLYIINCRKGKASNTTDNLELQEFLWSLSQDLCSKRSDSPSNSLKSC